MEWCEVNSFRDRQVELRGRTSTFNVQRFLEWQKHDLTGRSQPNSIQTRQCMNVKGSSVSVHISLNSDSDSQAGHRESNFQFSNSVKSTRYVELFSLIHTPKLFSAECQSWCEERTKESNVRQWEFCNRSSPFIVIIRWLLIFQSIFQCSSGLTLRSHKLKCDIHFKWSNIYIANNFRSFTDWKLLLLLGLKLSNYDEFPSSSQRAHKSKITLPHCDNDIFSVSMSLLLFY